MGVEIKTRIPPSTFGGRVRYLLYLISYIYIYSRGIFMNDGSRPARAPIFIIPRGVKIYNNYNFN